MKPEISSLNASQVRDHMSSTGLRFQVGPFSVNLISNLPDVVRHVSDFYSSSLCLDAADFCDFHVRMTRPSGVRRWLRPQVRFLLDEHSPFKPLPVSQAYAMFEWGLNWCIATHAHHFLVLHSAVVEKNGSAIIMPGIPGAGKSTLCAALVCRGWRLLSDEMALVDLESLLVTPIPRPVALKNESIHIIGQFAPQVVIGPSVEDTSKGTVAHMAVPHQSAKRAEEKALPRYIAFPQYSRGAATKKVQKQKSETLMQVYENAFNSYVLGGSAFVATKRLVDQCETLAFEYSDLDEAINVFDSLV